MYNKIAMKRTILTFILTLLSAVAFCQTQYYVSPQGNDSWSGTVSIPNSTLTDGPKQTLAGAQNAVRLAKATNTTGFTINVAPGIYAPLNLTSADSGTSTAPIIWRSASQYGAVIEGGYHIGMWVPLSQSALALDPRISSSVASKLYVADISAISNLGSYLACGYVGDDGTIPSQAELFVNFKRQQVARWPNSGWASVATGGTGSFTASLTGSNIAASETDVWYSGYPYGSKAEYSWLTQPATVDSVNGTVTLNVWTTTAPITGSRFKLYNSLSTLDAPGEYYIDKINKLVVWYPTVSDPNSVSSYVSNVAINGLQMTQVNYVSFIGFKIENIRNNGVFLNGCNNVQILGNTIQDVLLNGIVIHNYSTNQGKYSAKNSPLVDDQIHYNYTLTPDVISQNISVQSNKILDCGEEAVQVWTGDCKFLTSSNTSIKNNIIKGFAEVQNRFGVSLNGCGIIASNNILDTGPSVGIIYSGNKITIDNNNISNVCTDVSDYGAIYTGGNDGTHAGNTVSNNWVSLLNPYKPNAFIWPIYLDSHAGNELISGNLLNGGYGGILINSGQYNGIVNNIVCNSPSFTFCSGRFSDTNAAYWATTLNWVDYMNPPYSTTYPTLLNLLVYYPEYPIGTNYNLNVGLNTPSSWQSSSMKQASVVTDPTFQILWLNYVSGTNLFQNNDGPDFIPIAGSTLSANGFAPVYGSKMGVQTDSYITNPTVPVQPSGGDTTSPVVSIKTPLNRAMIGKSGLTVTVNATDNVGVTKVELYLDSVLKSSSTTAPFTTAVPYKQINTGSHIIYVKAYDAAKNVAQSTSIVIYK